MLCYICGLDVGKFTITTLRGEIVFICIKCLEKRKNEEVIKNDNN